MADWPYAPQYGASVSAGPPPTAQTVLDDGKVISRVKNVNIPEGWSEEYWFTGAEFDAAYAFYLSKGIAIAFTKVSYDLYGTPTQERTVRFAGSWQWQRSGLDFFTVTLTFARHY
jgi:hypothetical protein